MGKIKEYEYKMAKWEGREGNWQETQEAIKVKVPTKGKQKEYEFWIPKSACVKVEVKRYEDLDTKEEMRIVRLTMDSDKHWYYTWRNIQEYMKKMGYPVKQWREKTEPKGAAEMFLEEEKNKN